MLVLALVLLRRRGCALVGLTLLLFVAAFTTGVGDNPGLELPFRLLMAAVFVAGLSHGGRSSRP